MAIATSEFPPLFVGRAAEEILDGRSIQFGDEVIRDQATG